MNTCLAPFALILLAVFGLVGYGISSEVELLPDIDPVPAPVASASPLILSVTDAGDISTEALTLENQGDPLDLTGWQIVDSAGNTFTFPELRLMSGATITIVTGDGSNTPTTLYWGSDTALWNAGVTITLQDADGLYQAQIAIGE